MLRLETAAKRVILTRLGRGIENSSAKNSSVKVSSHIIESCMCHVLECQNMSQTAKKNIWHILLQISLALSFILQVKKTQKPSDFEGPRTCYIKAQIYIYRKGERVCCTQVQRILEGSKTNVTNSTQHCCANFCKCWPFYRVWKMLKLPIPYTILHSLPVHKKDPSKLNLEAAIAISYIYHHVIFLYKFCIIHTLLCLYNQVNQKVRFQQLKWQVVCTS